MASNAVEGFLPSRNGFRFANRWPSGPAWTWQLGLVQLGIGDVGRGLCGGMAFVAADRFTDGAAPPAEEGPPAFGDPLFREIVSRQVDSFGRAFQVPARFAMAAFASDRARLVHTVRVAWPRVRRSIDDGRLAMVGLVRRSGSALVSPDFGHQVVAYRYEASRERVVIGVYDPNHPGDDTVELVLERAADGSVSLAQSTGEPLLGLLALPWEPKAPPR
ncbi:MAG TPA: hypothetical protein VJ850_07645 [Candidatus Limnocylindrales bacterium]|nr:hypothetical protein [Candidatus Limnocylindrales bacterium]